MKNGKFVLVLTLLFIFVNYTLNSCTTAIISGKYTPDGRPLLIKHRDSDFFQNKLVYFTDGKFNYIGLINSQDKEGKEVWGGCNSAGFAIMNSASYNLKGKDDTTKLADREGEIMKLALQTCQTVDDFENLLKNHTKPLGVEANFGVIDADGNAAYFETNNFTYTKFDVNDPLVAPNGYLIRTNYSFSGEEGKGFGYIRYATTEDLFKIASKNNDLSINFLIEKLSRCLSHSLTGMDLYKFMPKNVKDTSFFNFEDFIPRYSSTSTIAVQGIKPGDRPEKATIWTILGFQLASVVIPTWVVGGENLPKILNTPNMENAPLCDASLKLKKDLFSYKGDGSKKYMNISTLINKQKTGILQKLFPIEKTIIQKTAELEKDMNKTQFSKENIENFYAWIDKYIRTEYKRLFNLEIL
jgi:hypothetical protein